MWKTCCRCWLVLFALLSLEVTMSSASASTSSECLEGWKKHNGFCYLWNATKTSWNEARDACSKLKADLLDIRGEDEKKFVQKNLTVHNSWIGLSKNKSQADMKSSEELIDHEECVVAKRLKAGENCKPETTLCDKFHPSICINETDTNQPCPQGWKLDGKTCYLVVNTRMTWFGAHANCLQAYQAKMITWHQTNTLNIELSKWFWMANRYQFEYDRDKYWAWLNGTNFTTACEWNVVLEHTGDKEGCAKMVRDPENSVNYNIFLTADCSTNLFYICKAASNVSEASQPWGNNGTFYYLSNSAVPWENISCTVGKPLTFNNTEEKQFVEKQLSNRNISSVWLEIHKNASRKVCVWIDIFHNQSSTETLDYTLSKFVIVKKEKDKQRLTFPTYSWNTSQKLRPLCFANKSHPNGSCQIQIGEFCYFVINWRMSWVAAQAYCLRFGAKLAKLNTSISTGNLTMFLNAYPYWTADRRMYSPKNPIQDWVWVNRSKLTVNNFWGAGKLRSNGYQRRCGVINNDTWLDFSCDSVKFAFICKVSQGTSPTSATYWTEKEQKKQVTALESEAAEIRKAGPDFCLQSKNTSCEEHINKAMSTGSKIFTDSKKMKSKTSIKAEEIIAAVTDLVDAIVSKPSFNGAIYISTKEVELIVFSSSWKELNETNSRNGFEYLPKNSIEKLCQNKLTCTVKGVKLKIKNVSLDTSLLTDASPLTFADVISLDYYAADQRVSDLQEKETIKIPFKRKGNKAGKPGCFFLDHEQQWNDTGIKTDKSDNVTVLCVTNHLTSFAMIVTDAKYLDNDHKVAIEYISYIGSGLSLTGLTCTILLHALLYEDLHVLTTSRHLVHVNLQVSLGLTQIVFLAGVNETENSLACKMVAIILHYLTLASLCWMLLEGAMLYLKVISVYGGEVVRMKFFCGFGWGFPLFFVAITALVNGGNYTTGRWCWLAYDSGKSWIFFAPVMIITALNLIVLLAVIRVLLHATEANKGDKMKKITAALRGFTILFPVLGLSWIFGIVAVNHQSAVWVYLFAIFNSSQGFFVFLIYGICNQELKSAIKRRMGRAVHSSSTTLQLKVLPMDSVKDG